MCIVKVLGSGDAFHSGGRFQASFLIKDSSSKLLIDCGGGSLQQLKRYGYATTEITAIIISHLHGDHIAALPFLLMDMARLKRQQPLYILSPNGLREICRTVLKSYYPGHEKILETLPIIWITYDNDGTPIYLDGITVEPFKMVHAAAVLPHGVKISLADRVIAYSGDTEWNENIIRLAANTDLFICECTFFNTAMDGHLSYETLSEKIESIDTRRMLLTHFDEEMLDHADQVALDMAQDGQEIILGSNIL